MNGIEHITIYTQTGGVRAEVIPNDGSTYSAELMKKEELALKFTLAEPVLFQLGDWCECRGGRFEVTQPQRPTANSAGGWRYELTMPAHYWKWANKILYYDRQHARECSFTLTHDIAHHAALILSNLAALGYQYEGKDYTTSIGSDVTAELRLVSYSNTSITDALTAIADAFECEWWVTGNVIHFGRCELGTEVELAEGDEVQGMSASDSSQSYATRLIAFGSTRNLTQAYRPDTEEVVVGSIREKRLMLPAGTPYIDTEEGLSTERAVEKVLVFDDIYPRRVGTIAAVTTKTYTDEDTNTGEKTDWQAYRFTDEGINFSSDYRLKDSTEALKVIFQSGSLAGMTFDVNFNPDGLAEKDGAGAWNKAAQVYEIVRNDTYGIKLPNDTLKPAAGDKYVLFNFDISYLSADLGGKSNYIGLAEQELLEAAKKEAEKLKVDSKSYSCPMNIVRYYGYTEGADGKLTHATADELDFSLGQKIKLVNPAFFKSGRSSRVYGFEKYLDGTKVTYTVSGNREYSRLQELSDSISTLAYNGYTYKGAAGGQGGGASIYLITTHDATTPSDNNAYSAARALAQFADKDAAYNDFLRKNTGDKATGYITFEGGASVTELAVTTLADIARAIIAKAGSERFSDGFTGEGWQIWQQNGESSMTLDRITVRKAMTVLELLIERIRAIGGQLIVSAANGKIKEVKKGGGYYNLTLEEGHGTFTANDYVRCQAFTGGAVKSYWARVRAVSGDTISVDAADITEGNDPAAGDELVLLGNATDEARQSAVSISATEDGKPRIDVLNGITGPTLEGCLRARLGDLSGISDSYFPANVQPQGHGLYSDNAYLHGTFVLKDGREVSQLFSIMDGKLQSVISEDWNRHNLLANGWFLNGPLGWQNGSGGIPQPGGTAIGVTADGVLTNIGYPVVTGKTASEWAVKAEGGITYLAITGNDGTLQTMYFNNMPAEAGALTLSLKVRTANTSVGTSLTVLLLYNDGETFMPDAEVPAGTEWTTLSFDLNAEVKSITGLMFMAGISDDVEMDFAQITLAAKQITRSEIKQTAKSISLSVTEDNNGKLKKAGIDIDKETVTISAAHTLIEDENGNPVTAFEGGKLKTAFLDLGSLNLSSDDIPMIGELTPSINNEAVTAATKSVALSGTNGTKSTETLTFSVASFVNDTASKRIYFSARASANDSLWLRITETEVVVEYESRISDDLYKTESCTPTYRGGGNWSFETDKPIRNLKVTLTAKTLISTASSMEVAGRLTLSIGGYQGGDAIAIVPLSSTSMLTETIIGANGFASIWQSSFIFHLQSNSKTYIDGNGVAHDQPAGCTIMAGDYGWRITAGGIQTTADRGLNWK